MNLLRAIHVGRALLALLLALALWILVQNEQNPERSGLANFAVGVDVVDIPSGLTMVGDPPEVQLWIRAPENIWSRLRPEAFRARVVAQGAQAGLNELPVQVDSTDSGIRSVEPRPEDVRVRLEAVAERSVPVKVNATGNVPFGYNFTSPKISPEQITVIGPESQIQRVDAAVIDIRLEGVTVSVNGTYTPRPVDARGQEVRGVRIAPPQVAVEVPVNQQVGYKEVGIRPATTGKPAPGYYLLPLEVEPVSATIVGPPSVISGIDVLDTSPVDVNGASSSIVRRTTLDLPSGISLLQPQISVLVTVRVEPLELTQVMRLQPTVENLGPELVVASELPLVELGVTGPAPTLQSLNPRDFRITLNLSELGPGRHMVQPQPNLPSSFQLEQLEPREIPVEIRRVEPPPTPPTTALLEPQPIPQP